MTSITLTIGKPSRKLFLRARLLAVITILYNIVEGVVSVWFGLEDDTLALFGFGLDSFVEVISAVGILHMVSRQARTMTAPAFAPDHFEATALRITGGAFYLLAAGLTATVGLDLYAGNPPETTLWGIIVASVSIVSMGLLINLKMKVGRALRSDAIVADANCTRACLYLSIVLLISSVGYEVFNVGWIDSIGALAVVWFAIKEGRESFEKAQGKACSCAGGSCSA